MRDKPPGPKRKRAQVNPSSTKKIVRRATPSLLWVESDSDGESELNAERAFNGPSSSASGTNSATMPTLPNPQRAATFRIITRPDFCRENQDLITALRHPRLPNQKPLGPMIEKALNKDTAKLFEANDADMLYIWLSAHGTAEQLKWFDSEHLVTVPTVAPEAELTSTDFLGNLAVILDVAAKVPTEEARRLKEAAFNLASYNDKQVQETAAQQDKMVKAYNDMIDITKKQG